MNVGDIISGPHFPEVIEVKRFEEYGDEFYLVEGIGRNTNQYYEQLLEKDSLNQISILSSSMETNISFTGIDIKQQLIHLALENEDKYSNTRSLGNKNIIPLPHQIEAVYSRMLQTPSVRFLLADDPGAGKTIMSGMLIKELKARESIKRILILVPPIVLHQWQEEMKDKFQEPFKIINRAVLNEYGNTNPFTENDFCLASLYWASRDEIKLLILESHFDLVIIDEAHKMAAYSYGKVNKKTTKTRLYHLGEKLLARTEHCLLLTATPHKGDAENFRLLMKLIEPDLFNNEASSISLKDKSNPFIIRRLKESMVNFDSTPIFPKRTTKTMQYELTEEELHLYDAVTEYVRIHFNRALNSGHNSTAFAMMLLQRRLSSSIEAIHKSLHRRYTRLNSILEKTEEERTKISQQFEKIYVNNLEEETTESAELLEKKLEVSLDTIDVDLMKEEIYELEKLLHQTDSIRKYGVEKKFLELEEMLFGIDGLFYTGEKILIFTESVDTLNYLEGKLRERVESITKIIGSYSMDERRRQVELFKGSSQIMLATDAGGESINLQFCNQMINYDIPWNPNRLEQRMGRIHRIGQKNEVFIFNLVAQNTREGYVMMRLLEKLETMKSDLGNDLVYNFLGDLLDGDINLADLMKDAILNRQNLNDVVANLDKKLTNEHETLLETMKKMQFDIESIDIASMKESKYDTEINKIPNRMYFHYIDYVLNQYNVKIFESNAGKVKRIDRFPKHIRDQFPQLSKESQESYRFTGYTEHATEDIEYITKSYPIYDLTQTLMNKNNGSYVFKRYLLQYEVPEHLKIDLYRLIVKDGMGKELVNKLIYVAERKDGSVIEISSYWLLHSEFSNSFEELPISEDLSIKNEVLNITLSLKNDISNKRTEQLNRMHDYLNQTFNNQYDETYEKLVQYQLENQDNKNSALINQMNAQLFDIDEQKKKRMELINKQRTISLQPPKKIAQFELIPNGHSQRVMAEDYYSAIKEYEQSNGRKLVKMYKNLALVDFYSERFNGEERFIIITKSDNYIFSEEHIEDLNNIIDKVYVYTINGSVIEETKVSF